MRWALVVVLCLCLFQMSCSKQKRGPVFNNKVPLTKVKGKILVDGKPERGVIVMYTPVNPVAETRPEVVSRFWVFTNEAGEFNMRTYEPGDGIPEGEYRLNFQWTPTSEEETARLGNLDKLGGQYSDPEKPVQLFTAKKSGTPLEIGLIELKSASVGMK